MTSPTKSPRPTTRPPPLASPDPDASMAVGGATITAVTHHNSTLDVSSSSLTGSGGSSHSTTPIVCRICYSTCGTLYAFCKCKGSVGYVHKECLKRWIDAKLKANKCEICQSPFNGTDWSFKALHRWKIPKLSVLDKLYLALFVCCSIIVLYSIPWISYKAWRARDVIFGDGPITSERVFAMIVIAVYVPLNISCIASLVVLWRRAVSNVCRRLLNTNKRWKVRVTSDVAVTKLINAFDSNYKSPRKPGKKDDEDDDDDEPLSAADATTKRCVDETILTSHGENSGDSSTMLLTSMQPAATRTDQQQVEAAAVATSQFHLPNTTEV